MRITIPEQWKGRNIEDLLRNQWRVPKKLIHNLRMDKAITLNGKITNWNITLNDGDELFISLREEGEGIAPYPYSLDILYEDDFLIVVNKPADMATHPNDSETNTLANAVSYHLQNVYDAQNPRHVHRLDKNTSGAILFAKNIFSQVVLDRMLTDREIKRTYWALADGIIRSKNGKITEPIGRDRHHPTRRRVSKTGQHAITHYKVINTFPKDKLSLIECSLETGRTHQIRVHLSFIGHPLAGDELYGGSSKFTRQALHARKLEFIHPFLQKKVQVTAPFLDNPPIFENFL
ncbi:RluA family pseudouridine synthase [Bacillus sp. FJAT-49732]|uniref:Pseudouridine synthase n=1 Tax=Lederbergia citrisecunda TaxID=2833583 RepID=A0A942YJU1_9BACI|nr:RluA family pseudouridine synthase [Lederbergia citrisecunda]MBS4198484.1 RluA family pseudouridine synthase [Lederbergia citrisecunda]